MSPPSTLLANSTPAFTPRRTSLMKLNTAWGLSSLQHKSSRSSNAAAFRRTPNARSVNTRVATPCAPCTGNKPSSQPPHPAFKDLAKLEFHNPTTWGALSTEAEFMAMVNEEVLAGRCPAALVPGFKDFYCNYRETLLASGVEGFDEALATKVQSAIVENALRQISNPYEFDPHHTAVVEPFNYYNFGQAFTAPLINLDASLIGHMDRLDQIEQQLADGDNVIILGNHQTEVDPAVWSHLLKSTHPKLAEEIIYIAGDRVITDAIFKPLSMGRNLFCVHSKKHMDDIPELKTKKMETNRKTLMATQRRLAKGGTLMWVAPSGGRNRPSADGKYLPDAFDTTVVELMQKLLLRQKCPGHLVPMAMYSYPIMPPPPKVEQAIGEQRLTGYAPVGISLCEDLPIHDKSIDKDAMSNMAWQAVADEYAHLEAAIYEPEARGTTYLSPMSQRS
eukprot:gene3779-13846_t